MTEVGIVERLTGVLCDLYRGTGEIETLFYFSDLDPSKFDCSGSDTLVMSRGLRAAEVQEKLIRVIEAAMRRHGRRPELLRLLYEIQPQENLIEHDIVIAAEGLRRFRTLLDQPRHLTHNELSEFRTALQEIVNLRETARSLQADGDSESGRLAELNEATRDCVGDFQVYSEVIDEAGRTPRRRVPGRPDVRPSLADVAGDRKTLVDLKQNLSDAITEVLRSANSLI